MMSHPGSGVGLTPGQVKKPEKGTITKALPLGGYQEGMYKKSGPLRMIDLTGVHFAFIQFQF
jgi:hypothetical protein